MSHFKPSLVTLALVAAGVCSPIYAADKVDDKKKVSDVEVIQVTGIRRSLQLSQAIKMSSSSIVEAVSAEDIGKLPDVSIAESIARLPGLTTQRLDGRANVISIRGLAPDFTTATLNGREQVTVGDNRGIEFDQFPSELMSGVVIYKTPDASVIAQAIGGTVDMQTIHPLAHGKKTIAFGLRAERNDLGALNSGSTANGFRGSFSYVDQFADDTIGIAIGYAKMSSPNQEERWNAWGYPNHNYDDSAPLILGGAKPYVRSSELTRDGLLAVFEYQPNASLHTTVDAYYSKFEDVQRLRGIEIPGQWGTGWAVDSLDALETTDGLVTKGVINDVRVVMRNDVNFRDAETLALGWNTEYIINDSWTVEADLSYSKAERTDFGLESYSGTGRGNDVGAADTIGFELNSDGGVMFTPGLDYSDPSIMKIGGPLCWGSPVGDCSQDGFINTPSVEDELSSIRLSAERLFSDGVVSSIDFGINYSEREKSKIDKGIFLTLKDYPNMSDVPAQYQLDPTSLAFIGMGDMLSYDSLAFYNDGNYIETDAASIEPSRVKGSWNVLEKVTTVYLKANIDTELNDMSVTGNVGLQIVHTDQSSDGVLIGADTIESISDGDTYTELLPSLNFSFEIADDQFIRVGAARTLARARMDQMNSNSSWSFDSNKVDSTDITESPWSADGGNAKLRPWMALQYDVSYEYYFSDQGYFSAAIFYKDLENYIFKESVESDFSGFTAPNNAEPVLNTGQLSTWKNGNGGYIQGAEVSLTLAGNMLSDSLDGFGAVLSASYTDSEVQENDDSDPIDMPGLSEQVVSAMLYYEKAGFQSRISARYRSDFLGEVTGLSLARQSVHIKAETIVDAQIGYDFSESNFESLDGLTVQFQINNLTNEAFTSYQNGDARQVRDFQNYGRNFMIGFNYKM